MEGMHARLDAFIAGRLLESQDARRQNNGPLFEASVSTFIDESEDVSVKRHPNEEVIINQFRMKCSDEEPCPGRWQPFKPTPSSLLMHERQARSLFPIVLLIRQVFILCCTIYLSYLVTKRGAVCR